MMHSRKGGQFGDRGVANCSKYAAAIDGALCLCTSCLERN
jgi:hypothetical protein